MVGGKRIDDPRGSRSSDTWAGAGRPPTGKGTGRPPARPITQRRPLSTTRGAVLIVTPEEAFAPLAEAFEARGLSVVRANDLREAAVALDGERLDAAFVAVGLEDTALALELVKAARERSWGTVRSWSVRLPEADDDLASAARAAGVDEILPPSAPPVAVAATVVAALARAEVVRVGGAALAGPIDDLSVAEIVQALLIQRRGGTLRVVSQGLEGRIALGAGTVRHAEFGGDRGEDALFRLFALRRGDFWFDAGEPGPEVTIARDAQALLVDALVRAMR